MVAGCAGAGAPAAVLAALAGAASAAGPASAGSSSAALVPPLWPTQFDAEWDLCCEYGTTSWHGTDWLDHQTVSYDYALRRQSTLHTDMCERPGSAFFAAPRAS